MRIGQGYDAHKLIPGKGMMLGGIFIDSEFSIEAHSDGDVIIHALIDSLLGAAALGDIGTHFPDTDKKYKNIDSKLLLGKVIELCNKKGFKLSNADITILLQEPKISKYKLTMIEVLSNVLNVEHSKISIKATTTEGLGFIGREEGVAAHCVVIMESL